MSSKISLMVRVFLERSSSPESRFPADTKPLKFHTPHNRQCFSSRKQMKIGWKPSFFVKSQLFTRHRIMVKLYSSHCVELKATFVRLLFFVQIFPKSPEKSREHVQQFNSVPISIISNFVPKITPEFVCSDSPKSHTQKKKYSNHRVRTRIIVQYVR